MRSLQIKLYFVTILISHAISTSAQLNISPVTDPLSLAQSLVGNGVSISNVTFTGRLEMVGHFTNKGRTNIPIDSGIILTSGRAKSDDRDVGVDGRVRASSITANNAWGLPGDPDIANEISNTDVHDACVLEFDFIPQGDSIGFNYVFSSEEYTPAFVCSFNDAFAFFISGPGIPGLMNIARVPATSLPVSIFNVNNVPGGGCPNNVLFYIDNTANNFVTHDGHTRVMPATARVVPCQTYHLKIVITDVGDGAWDSGVFLQAKSLSSNAISLSNLTQIDPVTGLDYLAEGCATGLLTISRPKKDPVPLVVNLTYGGTAINGLDVTLLPSSLVIPANDSFVSVSIIPTVDLLPEGIEELKIYALGGCGSIPADSTIIQLRDYDILDLTPDNVLICHGNSVQLIAAAGYASYQWRPDPTLSSTTIRDPVATPVNPSTYICTANLGNCNAMDSVIIGFKTVEIASRSDVNCKDGSDGQIIVATGAGWLPPVEFSLDGINWQSDGTFNNMGIGNHWVKIRDADCTDSILVTITQAFPDLLIANISTTPASCSGAADGTITITGSGGNGVYTYSNDGINFQTSNTVNSTGGAHTVSIKDGNGCITTQLVNVPYDNSISVDAGADDTICNGASYQIRTISNADNFSWTPTSSLDDPTLKMPFASPSVTTKYYVTATTGACVYIDSILLTVRIAPIPDAGDDIAVCYGKTIQLSGSGGIRYQWSPATHFISPTTSQNPDVKARENISYYLMVTDINNCRSLLPDTVNVSVTEAVRIFAGNDTIAAIGQPIQLNVRETGQAGVTRYSWTPASLLSNGNIFNPIASLTADQRFLVTGTTAAGCEGMDDILVKVYKGPEIYVPSGFTPNNDGLNDVLKPIPVGIKVLRYFRVYNRWGQLIFSTQEPGKGWDGRYRGMEQTSGTFVWMAEGIDYKGNTVTRRGTVSILR